MMPLSPYHNFINDHLTIIVVIGKIFLLAVWLSLLFLFLRTKKQYILILAIILLGSLYVTIDMLPLSRPYSLEVGYDRVGNLAMSVSIAEGNKIMASELYKNMQSILSPVLPLLLAILNWITNISVPVLYTYSPLLITVFLPIFIYLFWVRSEGGVKDNGSEGSPKIDRKWEAILIAFFVMFFTTDLDILRSGFVKGFWQMMFLVKPNHAVALIFIFPYIYFICRREGFYSGLMAGLFLSLIILSYILFGAFLLISTVIYLILRKLLNDDLGVQSIKMIVIAILVALITSIWYWRYFITFFSPFTAHDFAIESSWFVPSMKLLIFDPFESTLLMGHLFWLGVVGVVVMLRRKSKADLVILSLLIIVYLLKFLYPLSYAFLKVAPEPDDLSFFIRFAMAISAGIGSLSLVKWIGSLIEKNADVLKQNYAFRALCGILYFLRIDRSRSFFYEKKSMLPNLVFLTFFISTPILTPIWYFPNFFDFKWRLSTKPVEREVISYTHWIRQNTQPTDVFLAGLDSSQWVVALTGRKVALTDKGIKKTEFDRRLKFIKDFFRSNDAEKICDSIKYLEIDYLLKDKSSIDSFGDNFNSLISSGFLVEAYKTNAVQIYKVLTAGCDKSEDRQRIGDLNL